MRTRNWTLSLVMLLLAFTFSGNAQALVLGPGDMNGRYYQPSGQCAGEDKQLGCIADVFSLDDTTSLTLLYKSDYGGSDSGLLAGSYHTDYTGDPNNAIISYIDGMAAISCPECYLVVKDGNANPNYYFYQFDEGDWNGIETIYLNGFWVGTQGAISHVAIWGTPVGVPEPGALALLGIGLLVMTMAVRRRRIN